MSESALQKWSRRFRGEDQRPESEAERDSAQELEAAQRRFVRTFRAAAEKLGVSIDHVRSKALGEIYGAATTEKVHE